jgi:hypothetical protein
MLDRRIPLGGRGATGTACGDSDGRLLSPQQFRLGTSHGGFGTAHSGLRRGCLGLLVEFAA